MMQGGHGDDLSRTNESGLQDHRPHGDLYGLYGRVRPLRKSTAFTKSTNYCSIYSILYIF